MAERTVTITGLSKTFSVTGWRLGYAIAPPELAAAIRKVHDFLTVGAPAPLQAGGGRRPCGCRSATTLTWRDLMRARRMAADGDVSNHRGFVCYQPQGAYYVMTDIRGFGFDDDVAFVRHLVTDIGVAAVPGSSFYRDRAHGRMHVRFCFCKKDDARRGGAAAGKTDGAMMARRARR